MCIFCIYLKCVFSANQFMVIKRKNSNESLGTKLSYIFKQDQETICIIFFRVLENENKLNFTILIRYI